MISSVKGTQDLIDKKAALYEKIIKTCEEVAKNYSFSFINLPHMELSALFKRSVGESSDIVGKEMYEFKDKSDREIALRPEGTASAVRAYLNAKFDKNKAAKRWFYHGSMFRYERPQKGRFREFHQFGVESFGEKSVYEDINLIFILDEIFKKLGIKSTLKINSLGCEACMPKFREKLIEFLNAQSGFCEDCLRRKELNPIRVLDCKQETCKNLLIKHPKMRDCLCETCKTDFELLQKVLKDNEVKFEVDDRLVRGLDYYSKTAFEFENDSIGAKAAIAGGGRYDRLLQDLGSKGGYGVGFAIGIERIMDILEQNEAKTDDENLIYFCILNEELLQDSISLVKKLRQNKKVFMNYEAKKLSKHLELADSMNACVFLCMGDDEFKEGKIFYKNLKSKIDKKILINDLENFLWTTTA